MSSAHRPIRDGVVATVVGGLILAAISLLAKAAIPIVSEFSRGIGVLLEFRLSLPVWAAMLPAIGFGVALMRRRTHADIRLSEGQRAVLRPLAEEASRVAEAVGHTRERLRETPTEILNHFRAAPPASRRLVAEAAYHGKWVLWSGTVHNFIFYDDQVHIAVEVPHAASDGAEASTVFVAFANDQRDRLASLRENDTMTFVGRIAMVEYYHIHIDSGALHEDDAGVSSDGPGHRSITRGTIEPSAPSEAAN